MRADIFLFSRGFAKSRSHAAALIETGVKICGKRVAKPSQDIPENTAADEIEIENPSKYVSRGGYKLEGAIEAFSLDVAGMTALDLGASTGGFTDCLLKHGAKKVYAVDVGHGQLDSSLLSDPRVISIEGVNARELSADMIQDTIDIITCDLSFISQSLIYAPVAKILSEDGIFVSLIKPQFEAGRGNIGRGGIVKDKKVHTDVINRLFSVSAESGLYPHALSVSKITGGDGNREYLALFSKKSDGAFVSRQMIENTVNS